MSCRDGPEGGEEAVARGVVAAEAERVETSARMMLKRRILEDVGVYMV